MECKLKHQSVLSQHMQQQLYCTGMDSDQDLTIDEFSMREEGDGDLIVIPCVHHKTAVQKLVLLVTTEDLEEILQYYYQNLRTSIEPEDPFPTKQLFLDIHGGRIGLR